MFGHRPSLAVLYDRTVESFERTNFDTNQTSSDGDVLIDADWITVSHLDTRSVKYSSVAQLEVYTE